MGKLAMMTLARVTKQSLTACGEDKITRLASSISFAAIFSIAPLFIVLIAVLAAVAGGHEAAQERLLAIVRNSAGSQAAEQVRQIVAASYDRPRQGLIAQIVGWLMFVVGASNFFASLQDALNSIWRVEKLNGGWRRLLRDRLVSAGMIVVVTVLLAMTFAANAVVAYLTQASGADVAGNPRLLAAATEACTFVIETIVFTLILKVLPDVKITWSRAWFGGTVTAALFSIGQVLIGIYFTRGGVTSTYGAAGSLLVALLWIYYSTLILLFGAEVTKVSAGSVGLSVASGVRELSERPAGSDPRKASNGPRL
jgi:membrane protein